ncbi:6076_t:CDS:2 [Scutellospora calospora]|uniref:6076_t:CDS:1 n=1 Tax=Scutellospora calospora TaxID=85575 RepID=A0ACA9KWB3_9GLOM|nr:6076_t:CDS:2 [Scutellospora calospora]
MTIYEGNNLEYAISPKLLPDIYEIVPVTYDETIFYTNNGIKKSIGRLKLSEYECDINSQLPNNLYLKYTESCVTIYSDSNQNVLFMFNNSSNYGAFAEDALLVS